MIKDADSSQNREELQRLLSNNNNYDSTSELTKWDLDQNAIEPDLADLPKEVRETVPLTDDPSIPVMTFRYFVLLTLFIVPGAFIDTINSFRTTSAVYSIFFVQIASHWAGKWMAKTLPHRNVRIGSFSFSLNPGPWSIKETALVTITAKSGATGNLATNALALSELFFHKEVPLSSAIPFMWAIVFIGYSYAAIAKRVVSYDPQFPWPQTLMQTALLQSQDTADKKDNSKRMKVFFWCAGSICVWQMFPEYLFPMTSSLAVLCWVAPTNKKLNFIGSGMGGMGFLNFTLDWANITSEVMLYPYWVQVIQFIAFVCGAWVLLPLAKWSSLFTFKHGLMSNRLFTLDGDLYPTEKLMTPNGGFNQTAYDYYGPVQLGAQRAWNMFFDYAAYVSGLAWVLFFGWEKLRSSIRLGGIYGDRLNKLHAAYKDVPNSWYVILFIISMAFLLHVANAGYMFMPFWTCVIALVMGTIIVTPLMWLYALSNFQLPIGTFNELFYGYLVQDLPLKHPAGAAFFGCVAGNAWYRSQFHLELMKLGFYNHIPPRLVFISQIYGELIGVPINYFSLRWVLASKWDYLVGKLTDPLHQWTAQTAITYHTNAIQYVILGPRRLFANYPLLPLGFLVGLIAPVVIFLLHRRFPRSKFNFQLWNTTVFFSTMSHFYGNLSTGYLSKFMGGIVTMFYAYRYKHTLWKTYNYVVAAALDTGTNLAITIIFVLLSLGITAPTWFGNNPDSVERCFALE